MSQDPEAEYSAPETFILFGDPHIVAGGAELYGQDPARRLRQIVSVVNEDHTTVRAAFFLGDLVHTGSVSEYAIVADIVRDLHCPAYMVAGNHDDRSLIVATFPSHALTACGHLQYAVDTAFARFIAVDTVSEGSASGTLCPDRLSWLDAELASSARGVVLLMHHPPLALGYNTDNIRLRESEQLARVLERHRSKVKLIVFGHIHRTVCGNWKDFPFVALRGTGHQRTAMQKGRTDGIDHGTPSYALVNIWPDRAVVQLRDISVDRAP
jgi:3',5'-cyclic-AMP phosphodiesterase